MDILKRELAPIPAEAWMEIDEQAIRSLKAILSARKVIDVTGPMGTDFPGVPEGRLEFPKKQPKDAVTYGIHKVHHLVETRIPFELDVIELDNVVRGAKDVDLASLEEAATKNCPVRRKSCLPRFTRSQYQRAGALRRGRMPHDGLQTRAIAGSDR